MRSIFMSIPRFIIVLTRIGRMTSPQAKRHTRASVVLARTDALRANLMSNWQSCKYTTLIDLQNSVTNISLCRSTSRVTHRSGSSTNNQNKGKAPAPLHLSVSSNIYFSAFPKIIFRFFIHVSLSFGLMLYN
jgi:hypothetical protein